MITTLPGILAKSHKDTALDYTSPTQIKKKFGNSWFQRDKYIKWKTIETEVLFRIEKLLFLLKLKEDAAGV